jgi:hypothetical protein
MEPRDALLCDLASCLDGLLAARRINAALEVIFSKVLEEDINDDRELMAMLTESRGQEGIGPFIDGLGRWDEP